tara:strand:- start:9442 stop:9759 length:318 start_codon:yes stop_codon:yes gene_type:complete
MKIRLGRHGGERVIVLGENDEDISHHFHITRVTAALDGCDEMTSVTLELDVTEVEIDTAHVNLRVVDVQRTQLQVDANTERLKAHDSVIADLHAKVVTHDHEVTG